MNLDAAVAQRIFLILSAQVSASCERKSVGRNCTAGKCVLRFVVLWGVSMPGVELEGPIWLDTARKAHPTRGKRHEPRCQHALRQKLLEVPRPVQSASQFLSTSKSMKR